MVAITKVNAERGSGGAYGPASGDAETLPPPPAPLAASAEDCHGPEAGDPPQVGEPTPPPSPEQDRRFREAILRRKSTAASSVVFRQPPPGRPVIFQTCEGERLAARAETTATAPIATSSKPVPAPSVPTIGIGPDHSRRLLRLGSLQEGRILTRVAAARRPLDSGSWRRPSFFGRLAAISGGTAA